MKGGQNMKVDEIYIGNIIKDNRNKKSYILLKMDTNFCYLCEQNISKLYIIAVPIVVLVNELEKNNLIQENNERNIFDTNLMSEEAVKDYYLKKTVITEVMNIYKNDFIDLQKKRLRPEIKEITNKYGIKIRTLRKWLLLYFQSGFQNGSLVDSRIIGHNKGKLYKSDKKLGRPSEYNLSTGVVRNEQTIKNFEEAVKDYKSGRCKTIRSAYNKMNYQHYSEIVIKNGRQVFTLKSESERPTFRQFSYYLNKHITKTERDIIKTSAAEVRNDKRLQLSDSLKGVNGPGDLVEIDAVEADVSLISEIDNTKTVGRPIVYFMIDVYSKAIIAMSVSFDNNSMLALSSLFLNLGDNKKEYCSRYGIILSNDKLWPSNFYPRRVRVDRGSDFKSKEFERICLEFGIEKQLVTGGMGSLKGNVEQSFRNLHREQNVHLENYGLIEKRHDSNHHKEAALTVNDYTKMVINYLLYYNQRYIDNYPLNKEMIKESVKPIPAILFQYGVNKYGKPRSIINNEEYLYSLMTPIKVKITNKGIMYKGLNYIPRNDDDLMYEMYFIGTKSKSFEVRMDKRDISVVYYVKDNKLHSAILNPGKTSNEGFMNMSFKEYDDYRKQKAHMRYEGMKYNEQLEADLFAVDHSIVKSVKKDTLSNNKDLRENREQQKQKTSKENSIVKRLESLEDNETTNEPVEKSTSNESNIPNNNEPAKSPYSSWKEAIDDVNRSW